MRGADRGPNNGALTEDTRTNSTAAFASALSRPTISTHPPCVRCGYDLAGLVRDGLCPECGEPVKHSLDVELLGHLPGEQIAQLRRAATCVQWGVVIFGIAIPLSMLPEMLRGSGYSAAATLAVVVVRAIGVALTSYGWWQMTEPRGPWWVGSVARTGRVIRGATAVVLGFDVVRFVLTFMGLEVYPWAGIWRLSIHSLLPTGNTLAFYVVQIAGAVRFFASISLIRTYAKRIPSPQLHSQAKGVGIAVPTVGAIGAVACGVGPIVAWALYLGLIDNFRWCVKLVERAKEAAMR